MAKINSGGGSPVTLVLGTKKRGMSTDVRKLQSLREELPNGAPAAMTAGLEMTTDYQETGQRYHAAERHRIGSRAIYIRA
jgi:hypothetical protein